MSRTNIEHSFVWITISLLTVSFLTGIASASQQPAHSPDITALSHLEATNLLFNPSFEGEYHAYVPPGGHPDCPLGVCNTAQMADGWTPWWVSHNPEDEGYIIRMPEYKAAAPWANRIRTGANAQQYFSFYSTHRAGFYQRVSVQPGLQYRFAIWGHAWESNEDNPDVSDPTHFPITQRIGIDPTGGTNWNSSNVVWSAPHGQYYVFGLFQVCAVAQKSTLTVFTFSEPTWAAKHNDVYWDDAELSKYTQTCKTELKLSVSNGVTFLVEPDNQVQPIAITVSTPTDPYVSWSASAEQAGSITPLIQSGTGSDGGMFILSVNTAGKPVGIYSGTVTVTSDPPVIGSPKTITVYLVVAPEVHNLYLPGIVKR